MPLILVVEDDAPIRRGLVDALRFAGHEVRACGSGDEAMRLLRELPLDLMLLDVMLPGSDGFAVLEAARRDDASLPVIMVTARGAEDDRVRGLRGGADDYVVKPFSARELLARVEAVLRRAPERSPGVRMLSLPGCRIDLEERLVLRDGRDPLALTETETAILRYLGAMAPRTVDRPELLRRIWGMSPQGIQTRTVDMHIARLRDKIEADESEHRWIITVRGKGYRLGESVAVGAS